MDNKILELLVALTEKVDKMDSTMNDKFEAIDQRFERIENKIETMDERIAVIDKKADKSLVMIENLTKDIRVIAEVQMAHKEQAERQFNYLKDELTERIDVVELAIKNVAKDVKENNGIFKLVRIEQ